VGDLPTSFPRSNTSFAKLQAHMPFVLVIQTVREG
jgi:hypothetical protein